MKKGLDCYIYSPTDLINFMESEFVTWMDRFCLEFPDQVKPDEDDEAHKLLQALGNEHKKSFYKDSFMKAKMFVKLKKEK